jgi:hypothetical protein
VTAVAQFFPIYFAEELHMSPIAVNIIFILDPVVEVIMSLFGQRASLTFGRVEVRARWKCLICLQKALWGSCVQT